MKKGIYMYDYQLDDVPDRPLDDPSLRDSTKSEDNLDRVVDNCIQIIDMIENHKIGLYDEETDDLQKDLQLIKEYVRDAIEE